ncbi:conjugal transfer protein TraC [Cronobacter sakazakii]|uniref:TraC family protein n=3 Tax=Cronobacter sakazakii TaxID=28141 RepID=UPI0009BB49B5|nr:TraC family protein [Cronobacter sakazakii]MDK1224551.1 TraC family protein [Cronobacter turicensis]EJJ0671539.1 TraC family protein [Cronobacter sakazakii]EMC4401953.1 TraC family protein [Cronobacter sakazakii]KAB0805767.1 TraC family protein [Cronobacter sakazakii]KAB0887835.1 TraC family protein [Cronobacter sakazakii]
MLTTIQRFVEKNLFLKEEVTKSDVLGLAVRDQPSQYLPYMSFVKRLPGEDDDTNAFINFDNTIGWIWELKPLAFMGNDKLDKLHGVVRAQFPKGTVSQWILFPDHNLDKQISQYRNVRKGDDPITAMNMDSMESFLRTGAKGVDKIGNIPIRNFRLFFTLKNEQRISEELLTSIDQAFAIAGMEPRRWEASDLLLWASEFFNGKPNKGIYDPERPLRKQFNTSNFDFSGEGSISFLGHRHGICLYPNVVPQNNNNPLQTNQLFGGFMGLEDDMKQIKFPFMYTLTVIYEDLKKNIADKAAQTMFQRVGAGLAASLNQRIREFGIMQNMMATNSKFSYVIPQLWVFGDTESEARQAAAQAKNLWEGFDFEMMYETGSMKTVMFYSALPFGFYHIENNIETIDRHFFLDNENIARFLPVQGDFRGGGRPVQCYIGRKGQLISLDMFDKRANAHNFFVVAETGGGKSFLLNDMIDSYASVGAKVRITDLGKSYEKQTRIRKGRFIDFNLHEPICINPLDFIYNDKEDLAQNISAAQIVFSSCAYSFTGQTVTELEANLIDQACWAAIKTGDHLRGTDFLLDYFSNGKYETQELTDGLNVDFNVITETAHRLAYYLRNFGSAGPYGQFFTGPTTFNIKDDEFVCTDIEKLRSVKQLFFPMVMNLMNAITMDLYLSDRSRESMILFEEIASMVKKTGNISMDGMSAMIDEGYRRARKYRGAMGIVLQSPLDLEVLPGLGPVVKANAQWRYYLASPMYDEAVKKGLIPGITEGFPLKLLNSVRNARPRYGEVFIDCPLGMGVARLCVDQWRYWINTSDGTDVAAFDRLMAQGMEPVDALIQLSGVDPKMLRAG